MVNMVLISLGSRNPWLGPLRWEAQKSPSMSQTEIHVTYWSAAENPQRASWDRATSIPTDLNETSGLTLDFSDEETEAPREKRTWWLVAEPGLLNLCSAHIHSLSVWGM